MKLSNNLNYRIIDNFDITEISKELLILEKTLWNINQSRQNKHGPHKDTKSIFINDIDLKWDGNEYPIQKYFVSKTLNGLTDDISNRLEKQFDGKVGKTLYINLPAGAKVNIHGDKGYYLESVHRFHIPILTNDFVEFFLNGEIINMKPGICYEINNANMHGVFNKGNTDRIHLLMDIIPKRAFR